MEILVDVARAAGGRLTGTVGHVGCGTPVPFSGAMELLARIEELGDEPTDEAPDPTATSQQRTPS